MNVRLVQMRVSVSVLASPKNPLGSTIIDGKQTNFGQLRLQTVHFRLKSVQLTNGIIWDAVPISNRNIYSAIYQTNIKSVAFTPL